jgi:hypothetical protein
MIMPLKAMAFNRFGYTDLIVVAASFSNGPADS